jgi:amino acid transporter
MSSTVPNKQMTVIQAAFTGIVSWLFYVTGAIMGASVSLTFFALLGFGVITFAAKDLPDPSRKPPRAM